jgi:hypothetical protein
MVTHWAVCWRFIYLHQLPPYGCRMRFAYPAYFELSLPVGRISAAHPAGRQQQQQYKPASCQPGANDKQKEYALQTV